MIINELITEVKMSPGALKNFTASEIAQNMLTGFEAELLIPNLKPYSGNVYNEDYTKDIPFPTGVNWKRKIENWMGSGNAYMRDQSSYITSQVIRKIERLISSFREKLISDYISSSAGVKVLTDIVGKILNTTDQKLIAENITYQTSAYYSALTEISDAKFNTVKILPKFIKNENFNTMKLVFDRFDYLWPFRAAYNGTTPLDVIVDSFKASTGFEDVKMSTGESHEITRIPGRWIFEPDGSLADRDNVAAGIELVSPPMPVSDTLENINKVWAWARSINAKTNETCGFHMGVSIKTVPLNKIDSMKLAIFLGDNYVLRLFNRLKNTYTTGTLTTISNRGMSYDILRFVEQIRNSITDTSYKDIANIFTEPMRNEKYISINLHHNYIEFRSAGGNYLDKKTDIENTLMRYVRAVAIAADPNAEKAEYAKKLYKFLTDKLPANNKDSTFLFAKYISGQISLDHLKIALKRFRYESFYHR